MLPPSKVKGSRIPLVSPENVVWWGASLLAVIRGVTKGARVPFPRRWITMKAPNDCVGRRKVLTMSQVLRLLPKDLQVRTYGRQTCFLPRVPSNLVTSLAVIQYLSALSVCMEWGVAQLHSYVGHNSLCWSSTFNAILSHRSKLFANVYIYSFLHAVSWFNQVLSSVEKLIHSPLCCKPTMQTTLRSHELPWQQPWNCFLGFILEACKILSQL